MLNLLGEGLISWWCNHNVYLDFFQFDTTLLHEAVVLTDPSGKILFIVVSLTAELDMKSIRFQQLNLTECTKLKWHGAEATEHLEKYVFF